MRELALFALLAHALHEEGAEHTLRVRAGGEDLWLDLGHVLVHVVQLLLLRSLPLHGVGLGFALLLLGLVVLPALAGHGIIDLYVAYFLLYSLTLVLVFHTKCLVDGDFLGGILLALLLLIFGPAALLRFLWRHGMWVTRTSLVPILLRE